MRRRFSLFLVIALHSLFSFEIRADEACPTVRIAYTHNWFPIAYDEGSRKELGLGLAIQREIFKRLNQAVEFIPSLPWNRQLALLESGKVDAMAAIHSNLKRRVLFNYTTSYFKVEIHVFKRAESPLVYGELSDLIKFRGLIALGASYGTVFDKFNRDFLNTTRTRDTQNIVGLLLSRRADYMVLPRSLAEYLIDKHGAEGRVVLTGPTVESKPLYMAFSRKSDCQNLIGQINETIADMERDGTMSAILSDHTQSPGS